MSELQCQPQGGIQASKSTGSGSKQGDGKQASQHMRNATYAMPAIASADGVSRPLGPENPQAAQAVVEAPLGTLAHRNWTCKSHETDRVRLTPVAIRDLANTETIVGAQAFERVIFPALADQMPTPITEATLVWIVHPPNSTYLARFMPTAPGSMG